MNHLSSPRSTSRARWLAELSSALDEAQLLLARLAGEQVAQADADLLRARVEELRGELRSLHRRGFASSRQIDLPRPVHPDWRPRRD